MTLCTVILPVLYGKPVTANVANQGKRKPVSKLHGGGIGCDFSTLRPTHAGKSLCRLMVPVIWVLLT